MKTDEKFSPNVTGIVATKVDAAVGSKIWEDKTFIIASLSDALKNATLFRSNFTANGTSISIDSNKNATVYIALINDTTYAVSTALEEEKWKLRSKLNLTYGEGIEKNVRIRQSPNQNKFDMIFSKTINDKDNVTLKHPKVISESVSFAILIKEGKFCLINFFVNRRNINC